MWLFTRIGFYSVVRKAAQPKDEWHVRSRDLVDLYSLEQELETRGNGDIAVQESHPGSDYPYRIILTQAQFADMMAMAGEMVDYPNFKGEIAMTKDQSDKLGDYHEIWHVMQKRGSAPEHAYAVTKPLKSSKEKRAGAVEKQLRKQRIMDFPLTTDPMVIAKQLRDEGYYSHKTGLADITRFVERVRRDRRV